MSEIRGRRSWWKSLQTRLAIVERNAEKATGEELNRNTSLNNSSGD
jgi:hypothetical protein